MLLNDFKNPELVPISNVIGMASHEPLSTFLGNTSNKINIIHMFINI